MRATPPSRRMSAGTRSSAITAQAPAASAIPACSGVTTSMITPPLSISARPVFTRKVARSVTRAILRGWVLLQFVGTNAVFVRRFVTGVQTVGQALDKGHQCRVGAGERRAVGREVEGLFGVLTYLGHGGIGDRQGTSSAVQRELHRPQQQGMGTAAGEHDDQGLFVNPTESLQRLATGTGDDFGANVEQAKNVPQVAGEESHLIDADDHYALSFGQRRDGAVHLLASEVTRGFLKVRVVGAERALELRVIKGKERSTAGGGCVGYGRAAVLLDRSLL